MLALSLAVAVGCGDGGASADQSPTNQDTAAETRTSADRKPADPVDPANRALAVKALVTIEDLPNGATKEKSFPSEPCGPLPILRDNGASTAVSQLFVFGRVRMKEAVGVFAAEGPAAAGFKALNTEERQACISESLKRSHDGESYESLPARSLGIGDEDSLVRFVETNAGPQPERFTDVMSIRSGRCVAALLFLVEGGRPSDATARQVGKKAARRLGEVC